MRREPELSHVFVPAAGERATREPPASKPFYRRFPLRDQVRWGFPPSYFQHSRYSTFISAFKLMIMCLHQVFFFHLYKHYIKIYSYLIARKTFLSHVGTRTNGCHFLFLSNTAKILETSFFLLYNLPVPQVRSIDLHILYDILILHCPQVALSDAQCLHKH